uniref:Zinc finger protein 732 n=2 Tax=Cacopsylla melanoneura TaxID=428564 RepID=A0A8D8VPF0_9HEMI
MATNQMLVKPHNQNFPTYNHRTVKVEPPDCERHSDEDDQDLFDASKFCETILEEFQNGDLRDICRSVTDWQDIECLRNFIRIAPKPENVKDITACLLNLKRKTDALRQSKSSSKPKKTYPCDICGKVFGWPTDLKRHALIHSGLRPFSCPHCESSFNRSCLLRKHMSKLHPGLK